MEIVFKVGFRCNNFLEICQDISTNIIKQLKSVLPKHNIIVGCGGIFNYDDLKEKSLAGADLFQVYTGFVYEGPGIVKTILKEYLKEIHE